MTCPRCGNSNPEGAKFCSSCGYALEQVEAPPPQPQYAPPSAPPPPSYGPGAEDRAVESKANTAMLIEIVGGLFGFLGLGNIYVGRTSTGIVLLIGWWVFIAIEVLLMFVLVGFCLLPLNLIAPIFSGLRVRDYVRAARIY